MTPIDRLSERLFQDGPPVQAHRIFGLVGRVHPTLVRRATLTAALGWLPAFVLALLGAALSWNTRLDTFLADYAFHGRSLVAAPLLVLAEALTAARLGGIVWHFVDAGIVSDSERPRFDAAIQSTLRLRDAPLAELVVAVLAYVVTLSLLGSARIAPEWWRAGNGPSPFYSPAAWWQLLVSIPLVLTLVFGWIWRVILWTRFLWLVAHMKLRLIAAHPDLTAGLKFVGYSVRAFSLVAFGFSCIAAGPVANAVVNRGEPVMDYRHVPLVLVLVVLFLFGTPLLTFIGTLLEAWRRGVYQYGAIASDLGREFEKKWFGSRRVDESALEVGDFSATIDLYQFVAFVYDMRLVPYDLRSLGLLVVATILPFVPVVFAALPLDVILAKIASALL